MQQALTWFLGWPDERPSHLKGTSSCVFLYQEAGFVPCIAPAINSRRKMKAKTTKEKRQRVVGRRSRDLPVLTWCQKEKDLELLRPNQLCCLPSSRSPGQRGGCGGKTAKKPQGGYGRIEDAASLLPCSIWVLWGAGREGAGEQQGERMMPKAQLLCTRCRIKSWRHSFR